MWFAVKITRTEFKPCNREGEQQSLCITNYDMHHRITTLPSFQSWNTKPHWTTWLIERRNGSRKLSTKTMINVECPSYLGAKSSQQRINKHVREREKDWKNWKFMKQPNVFSFSCSCILINTRKAHVACVVSILHLWQPIGHKQTALLHR